MLSRRRRPTRADDRRGCPLGLEPLPRLSLGQPPAGRLGVSGPLKTRLAGATGNENESRRRRECLVCGSASRMAREHPPDQWTKGSIAGIREFPWPLPTWPFCRSQAKRAQMVFLQRLTPSSLAILFYVYRYSVFNSRCVCRSYVLTNDDLRGKFLLNWRNPN